MGRMESEGGIATSFGDYSPLLMSSCLAKGAALLINSLNTTPIAAQVSSLASTSA